MLFKINKFYKIFGESLGITPCRVRLKDLKQEDFLLGVQYDVLQALEAYPYCSSTKLHKWLKKLYKDIRRINHETLYH